MDIASLIPAFGGLIWTLAAFVVALSIIVAVHEYGHYIVGRWCGIRAEVFSIGFGKPLFSRVDRHGTRWQVALLPFGGYVKFLGDSSAASDAPAADYDQLSAAQKRQTMHGAPLWARAATVAAGPAFNFALSIVIFAAVILAEGVARSPVEVESLRPLPVAVGGLAPGDRILAVDGEETPDIGALYAALDRIEPAQTLPYAILRDGVERVVPGPWPFPPLVETVTPASAAEEAGLRPGDVITAIDGVAMLTFRQLQQTVGLSDGGPLVLTVWRDGTLREVGVTPIRQDLPRADGGFETRWLIGLTGGLAFDPARETPGLWQAVQAGAGQIVFIIRSSLSGMAHMITGAISSCNLSGPIGIAESSGQAASAGAQNFIWFIAVLSTAVGLVNLFPIPVLDGGHLMFHAWEATTGRPPSDRVLRVLMTLGLAIMGTLMVFVIGNDLVCP